MESSFFEERFIFNPETSSKGHVHASCIIETPQGNLLTTWYENGPKLDSYYYKSGDWDKSDDVRIGGAWFSKEFDSWAPPFVMSDTFGVSDNNPTLIIDKQKRLWVFYVTLLAVPMRAWESALVRYKISTDYENASPPCWEQEDILVPHSNNFDQIIINEADMLRRTSSRRNKDNLTMAKELTDKLNDPYSRRLGWMTRNHPKVLDDGTLILPLANENFNVAAMAITSDGGKSWKMSQTVPGIGVIQPSIVQLKDRRLVAFFRDTSQLCRIRRSESLDNGLTWSDITPTELPNPNSGIEAVLLQNGNMVMIYNDKETSPRDRIAVSLSTDEGKTWKWTRYLDNIPGERFSYPSVIQSRNGLIHVTYSYNLKTIKHVCFNESWIMNE